jgi:hypothetical protein
VRRPGTMCAAQTRRHNVRRPDEAAQCAPPRDNARRPDRGRSSGCADTRHRRCLEASNRTDDIAGYVGMSWMRAENCCTQARVALLRLSPTVGEACTARAKTRWRQFFAEAQLAYHASPTCLLGQNVVTKSGTPGGTCEYSVAFRAHAGELCALRVRS